MNSKKNSREDLERKRVGMFQIGLLTASSLMLAAFTYSSHDIIDDGKRKLAAEELEFRVEYEEKPEIDKPKIQERKIVKIQTQESNQANTLNENVNETNNQDRGVKSKVGPVGPPGPPLDTGFVYVSGEDDIDPIPLIDAKYFGGRDKMVSFITQNLVYPEIDRQLGVEGKVYVSFIVELDGSVTHVAIERGMSNTSEQEAMRIVRSFPKWIPGEDAYGKVRTRVRLPINFKLH